MNNAIIVFDFEVFAHDTLLGAIIIEKDNIWSLQTWDLTQITRFYEKHKDDFWVGHNNSGYDNFILEAVANGLNEEQIKALSDKIVGGDRFRKIKFKLNYFDLMCKGFYSLKSLEAYMGKAIHETEVDFNLPRKLNQQERKQTEAYNMSDLEQTYDDFMQLKNEFTLRLDVINEFGLDLDALHDTGTKVAAKVLQAKQIPGIENMPREPVMWPQLRVKNQQAIDFYMKKQWAIPKNRLNIMIADCPFVMSAGGIHAALKQFHCERALYFDVSGYYNLAMLNFDLLPRTIPKEGRAKYEYMYHEQLRLKKIDPNKRGVFKTILLSVFGSTKNQYCDFYDPNTGDLILLTGQMFIIDLCEKLEGKAQVVQANTDGVIAIPYPGVTNDEIKAIVDEWQARTGFVLKFDEIYDIHQRDVNNYMYRDKDGNITTVGEAVTHYGKWVYPFWKNSFSAKEPIIMPYITVQYFMEGKLPEETVAQYKDNLRMFQYICKNKSFDYLEYEETDVSTGDASIERIQNVNRAFAMKDTQSRGMIYKCKNDGKRAKISNLPDSVFIWNDEILSDEVVSGLSDCINYQYYIDRGYERIQEFVQLDYIKGVNV